MKRFFDNEEEFEEFDEEEGEALEASIIVSPELIEDIIQEEVAQMIQMRCQLLDESIKIAQKDIFWKWRGVNSKTQKIRRTFKELIAIIEDQQEE